MQILFEFAEKLINRIKIASFFCHVPKVIDFISQQNSSLLSHSYLKIQYI